MADVAAVQRLLMDSKAEARLKGAQEVAATVARSFREVPPPESYNRALQQVDAINKHLLHNVSANPRRGGLVTLRAIVAVIPFSEEHGAAVTKALCDVTFPVVRDQDPAVRVAALEACHQVLQKFRAQVFAVAFANLFRAMLAAVADKDRKVVTAGKELSATARQIVTDTKARDFPVEMFVSFLNIAFESTDAFVVNWVLDWHKHVHFLPMAGLIHHLPVYLRRVFKLLELTDAGHYAEEALSQMLDDVKINADSLKLTELMLIALEFCTAMPKNSRRVALEWVQALLLVGHERMLPLTHKIVHAVVDQQNSKNDPSIRALAARVNRDLQELVTAGTLAKQVADPAPPAADPHTASSESLPGATDTSRNAPEGEKAAEGAESDAQGASVTSTTVDVVSGESTGAEDPVPVDTPALISQLLFHLRSEEASHLAALQWIVLLHTTFPVDVHTHFDQIFDAVLDTFAHPSPLVLRQSIATLCTIAGTARFKDFVKLLLAKMERAAAVLLPKASLILKHLQLWCQGDSLEQCEVLFLHVAELLPLRRDKRFVCKLVITMNTMLLTSPEMRPLRDLLKDGVANPRAAITFRGLYECWCHDAIASISVCLLTRAYDLAHALVVAVGSAEMAPHTLVQLDRLVQLLESPVFSFVRVALLTPRRNRALVRALFGLQMILPQTSEQYGRLHKRLRTISSVVLLEDAPEVGEVGVGPAVAGASAALSVEECEGLLARFTQVQAAVLSYESTLLRGGIVTH